MSEIIRRRFRSHSDNLKSASESLSDSDPGSKMGGIVAIVVALTVGGTGVEAQQPGKIFRIGFLDNSTASGSAVLVDAFRQELNKLGWIEARISPSSTDLPSKAGAAT